MTTIPLQSPDWIQDLIVYEIATKGFTSPNGPESGTFRSAQAKLSHLAALGVNGIWLTGHSLSHPDHFYNIWTQYACIEPDKIDPSLGTHDDFRAFIQAAHEHGIRVFLDVIVHGVMYGSPLIDQHPDWFRGESWGMKDFDFDARIPELDNWWVDMWTRYIVEDGVDGYRIDLGMRRPDLWARIRANAARAGRSIIIMNELDWEGSKRFSDQSGLADYPAPDEFARQIDFAQRDGPHLLDPHHNLPGEPLADYGRADMWRAEHWRQWLERAIHQAARTSHPWPYPCAQLSCHDDGWQGSNRVSPYVARGSRLIFGYGALFSGMIPLFMAGEEFDAPYRPLPTLSPDLFGGANPGQGQWLYGGQLDWAALTDPARRIMFEDVKRLIAIRKQEGAILRAMSNYEPKHIIEVPFTSDIPCPPPYARWHDGKAILVVGNREAHTSIKLRLDVPLARMGMDGRQQYLVTDLWTGVQSLHSREDLSAFPCEVAPDKTPGGGLRLLKIEAR
jgi:hypothetical protein